MTPKSPFLVYQDFLSPLKCEEIVDALNCIEPDTDTDSNPIQTYRTNNYAEQLIVNNLQPLSEEIRHYYSVEYRGLEPVTFEWYPHSCAASPVRCENAVHVKNKWVKNRDRDLTGVVFLSDYQDNIPFDSEYEVYGGKLEFPQHRFGFNPQRGTLILYPSGPHFLNLTQPILIGDLFMAKFHIATASPLIYQPKNFPGDYRSWFQHLS
jgi:hypothetical protein